MHDFVELLVRHNIVQRKDDKGALVGSPASMARINRVIGAGQHLTTAEAFRAYGWITDQLFFAGLGFKEAHSVDASGFEGATHVFDLNEEGLSRHLGQPYDLLIDSGTTEHCFDVPAVFRNIFHSLAIGGYVIHIAPSNNYIDHGFYQLSPTLFHDYYSANGYDIAAMKLYRHTIRHLTEPWEGRDYRPGDLDAVSYGGLDNAIYDFVIIARKTAQSTADRKPVQSRYTKIWR